MLRAALARVAPMLAPLRRASDAVAYARFWGRVTAREVAEALDGDVVAAARDLDAAVDAGALVQVGALYRATER